MAITPPRPLDAFGAPLTISSPYHIAFVVDGVVRNVMHIEEHLASILLSNPKIVQTDHPYNGGAQDGWAYNESTGEFTPPIIPTTPPVTAIDGSPAVDAPQL